MIKNRSFESKFNKNLIEKHQNPIKPKNIAKINMMASGGVNELGGINKKIFEKFFGVALPKIKIHKTTESIGKASRYHAHSYAQGNNIYLGKDVKPIDTVEGQTVIAHEITHVLQQKYLDMSSQKEMVDPSVELERKAKVVEDRVRVTKGIDKSSGDYFRKWDVLPQRSYLARSANIGHSNKDNIIQRLDFSLNIDWGDVGSSLVDATVNQAKNIGGALSEAGSTALDGVSSVGKLAASGYTGMVAEGADLLGYEDTANSLRKTTNTLQQSAIYDFNEASSHLSKSGKYGTNVLGSVIGNQKVFSDKEIESTTGIVEELSPTWKKDDKYNKTLTEFGNKAIGAGLKGVQNLTGDFFTMKYGSWQYKSAEKYTNFIESVGSGLQKFDKTYLQQNIVTETLSNSVKGAVNSTIIKPGKNIAKSLEEGKFIESGTDLVSNANIATIAMNSTSGSLDGNITTLESHNIISEKQAKKFKVAKDTALAMTKLAFDIKNAKTKKDIANKRTNTLNTNIEAGKYTKNRVKGLLTVSENAVKSANYEMLKSSVGLFTEGAKGFDKYQGAKKDSQISKNFQFLDTLVDNKISYKNLESIDKIGLMGEESNPIQRLSWGGIWESTKNIGYSFAHSAGVVADGVSSVAKLSASGYTGMLSVGADALGYDKIAEKYSKVTKNLQSSASDDLNDATKHFAKSGKYGNNAITQLIDDRDMFSQKNIDKTVGARDLHYGRNKYNLHPKDEQTAIDLGWIRLEDKKAIYHRMGKGNENNHKYVSPDGHHEGVFYGDNSIGKKEKPVDNIVNEATYNYFSPNGISAVGHAITDILPYYIWGNSKKDLTTFSERIIASYNGDPEKYKSSIHQTITNKYKAPIQRWSLAGAWNNIKTTKAYHIGAEVFMGTLNAISAASKIAAGTALMSTGIGAGAGALLYAGALADINDVSKNIHAGYMYSQGKKKEEVVKSTKGMFYHMGLDKMDDFMDSKLVKGVQLSSDIVNVAYSVGTIAKNVKNFKNLKSLKETKDISKIRDLGFSKFKKTKRFGKLYKEAQKHFYKNGVEGFNLKNTIKMAKNPFKGVLDPILHPIKSLKGVKDARGMGHTILEAGKYVKGAIDSVDTVGKYVGVNNLGAHLLHIDNTNTISSDINTKQQIDNIKERGIVGGVWDYLTKSNLDNKQSLVQPKANNTKYAKADRVVDSSIKTLSTENKNIITNSIDELSMKIFRQLKSEISLEYARIGR